MIDKTLVGRKNFTGPGHLKPLNSDDIPFMGWRKKDIKPLPFHQETGIMPRRKQMERSPGTIVKSICYILFDNSPASAFTENALSLPKPSTSQQRRFGYSSTLPVQRTSPQRKQLGYSNTLSIPRSPSSELEEHGVDKHTTGSYSVPGSPQHGGGKFSLFRRKSSRSKVDIRVTGHSNSSSPDKTNQDLYYNGDVSRSSGSLFEIEVESEENAELCKTYNEEEKFADPESRVHRLESEVEMLRRRLEREEQEVRKLKDEVSSLRSSSASSQVESPKSDWGRTISLPEVSASDKFDDSRRGMSLPGSSRTSTSDYGDSHRYMEFCPSDEGQLVKLQELSRSRFGSPQVSDDEESLASVEDNVILGRSSLSAEDLEQYTSGLMSEHHMDTFLSNAVAALGSGGTLGNSLPYRGIGTRAPGTGQKLLADQSYEGEQQPRNIGSGGNGESRGMDDKFPLVLPSVQSQENGNFHLFFSDSNSQDLETGEFLSADVQVTLNESMVSFMEEEHDKAVSVERVEAEKVKADSEWFSQDFGQDTWKKKGMSIMEYGVPADPEIAERRRQVQLKYQELEEKLLKMLRSPRRDYSSRSMSCSSSSASSSGTSSPQSIESGSPYGSFRENEQSFVKVVDCDRDCCDGEIALAVKSDVQESTKIPVKDLDLELSSPRELLVSKFSSVAKTRSLPRIQPQIWDKETDMTGTPEVCWHPNFSRDLSFSVLTGYRQQKRDRIANGETLPAGDLYTFAETKSVIEERAVVPIPEQTVVAPPIPDGYYTVDGIPLRRFSSCGTRRTRFGEEAARLALQKSRSDVPGGAKYKQSYGNSVTL